MEAVFSHKTLDFLIENRLRNDKEWFAAHKEDYTSHVVEPLAELTQYLAPVLAEIDGGLICAPRVGGSISRIWRDTRYAHDKSLFRDNMWCSFDRQKGMGLPEFYFVISPEGFQYGCGYYAAGTASMESLRALILAEDRDFLAALAAYEAQDEFLLGGEMYKKSRHPRQPERLRNWLDRKNIGFDRGSADFDLLYSDRLARTVAAGYRTLAPMYRFLMKAEARRIQQNP